MKPVLEVKGLTRDFGGLRALNELDLTVNEGEIVALIGPNGAGKTTFFNCVTGIYKPTEGTVHLYGANGEKHLLNGRKPHLITALGMARTFQNIRLFSDMTVLENVMIGRHCRTKAGIWGALTRNPAAKSRNPSTSPTVCWRPCTCRICGTKRPATWPTVPSAVWRSPAPWLPSPACCCWTNPPPA